MYSSRSFILCIRDSGARKKTLKQKTVMKKAKNMEIIEKILGSLAIAKIVEFLKILDRCA